MHLQNIGKIILHYFVMKIYFIKIKVIKKYTFLYIYGMLSLFALYS